MGKIVTLTSGIRGGVGKSLLCSTLGFSLAPDRRILIVDVGGGVTQYFLQNNVEPPYARDLAMAGEEAILALTLSVLRREGWIIKRRVIEEAVELYLSPEVGELSNQEIDGIITAITRFKKYFDFIFLDMPAATNPHYYKLLNITDVEVIVLVPERSFWEMILKTVEIGAPQVIIVMNKYNNQSRSHRESWTIVTKFFNEKYPGCKLVKVPYDPVLKLVGTYGIEAILGKTKLKEETARALLDIIYHLEAGNNYRECLY